MRRLVTVVLVALAVVGTVSCGGEPEPARSYTLGLEVDDSEERYRYVATDSVDIRVGDEVTFVLDNTGSLVHDLQIVDPAGATIATAAPVLPGGQASVTARFEEAGFFRLNCLVDDHLIEHEMQTFIEVNESDG